MTILWDRGNVHDRAKVVRSYPASRASNRPAPGLGAAGTTIPLPRPRGPPRGGAASPGPGGTTGGPPAADGAAPRPAVS
jgi:hypothetical protein